MSDLSSWGRDLLHKAALGKGGPVVLGRRDQDALPSLERQQLVVRTARLQCRITRAGWEDAHRRWPDTVPAPPDHQPPVNR